MIKFKNDEHGSFHSFFLESSQTTLPYPSPVVIDMFGVIFDGTEDAAASTIGNIGTTSPAWIRMGPGMARGGLGGRKSI